MNTAIAAETYAAGGGSEEHADGSNGMHMHLTNAGVRSNPSFGGAPATPNSAGKKRKLSSKASVVSSMPAASETQDDDDEEDDGEGEGEGEGGERKLGRRKINIEFIEDKSRRHITFSKRKAGIMKKAYELSTLTGTQVLLLVASETGHVYTFATRKLQPLITNQEGKNLIQQCLNAHDADEPAPTVNDQFDTAKLPPAPVGYQPTLAPPAPAGSYQLGYSGYPGGLAAMQGLPQLSQIPLGYSHMAAAGYPPPPSYGVPSMMAASIHQQQLQDKQQQQQAAAGTATPSSSSSTESKK